MSDLAKPRLGGWLDGLGGNEKRETRWLTPKPLVEALGVFDLDPCGAPNHPLASITYLLENGDDGLRDPWFGRVWLNPPYGREAEPFLRKLADHGKGTALIFASTETRVFFETVWERATAILFIRGRVHFWTGDGRDSGNSAGKPSVLVAYGESDAAALAASNLGKFVRIS